MSAGQAVRETRVIRATGLPAQVIDTRHPESPIGPDTDPGASPGRFATWCPTHRRFQTYGTWKLARKALASPEDWCDGCRELLEKDGPAAPRDGGFSPEERERALAVRREHAEKRREAEERRRAAKAAAEDAETAWSNWVMSMPMVEPAYEEGEPEQIAELRERRVQEMGVARESRRTRREAEKALDPAPGTPVPKGKRKKELEAAVREAESAEQTASDAARTLQEEQSRIHRRAFLRACRKAGYRIRRNGTGTDLVRTGQEPLRLPPDYLPAELLG